MTSSIVRNVGMIVSSDNIGGNVIDMKGSSCSIW
jgi:hypothetical protein